MDLFISAQNFGLHNKKSLDLLENSNLNYSMNELGRKMTTEEILNFGIKAKVLIAGTENLDLLVEFSQDLKAICRVGVGTDNIPLNLCREKGIQVITTDSFIAESVAEFTLTLILAATRNLIAQNQLCRTGSWNKLIGTSLSELSIGVYGYGHIGQTLVNILTTLPVRKVFVYDKYFDNLKSKVYFNRHEKIQFVTEKEIISNSDVLSFHIPLTAETNNLVGEKFLADAKNDLILINNSRGQIINENELLQVLEKKLKLVALDVFGHEPYKGPLLQHPKVIATPHIASYTKKSRSQIEIDCIRSAISVISSHN